MPLPRFTLDAPRLTIREFVMDDLALYHPIANAGFGEISLDERRHWLEWQIMSYRALSELYQPPYGDRAIVLKQSGALIGSVGLVQSFSLFDRLPFFQTRRAVHSPALHKLMSPEMGLFWLIDPAHQGHGYATEAARALIDYAFTEMNLKRIVATTAYDNHASIGVMRKLGMIIERNPDTEPEWFQIVGILENPALS